MSPTGGHPAPSEPSPRPSRHPVRWLVGAAVLVVVAAIGVVVALFLLRDDPDAKDVDEALEDFRATSVPTQPPARLGPEAGVYLAEGEGREELSFPPVSQDDGATMPVTITHQPDGCWRQRVDFNEAHWQTWVYCADGRRVVEHGGQTYQEWDLGATTLDSTADFTCDPPSMVMDLEAASGDSWTHSCTGTNSTIEGSTLTEGPYTYVGPEELVVDGEPVSVRHYRQEHAITGAQEGSNTLDYWFTDAGLPVRMERRTEVATASPIGDITYHESGHWQLTSLVPIE